MRLMCEIHVKIYKLEKKDSFSLNHLLMFQFFKYENKPLSRH